MGPALGAWIYSALVASAALPPLQQPPTIRADVNLVQLHAKVTDDRGRIVSDLPKSAFELYVDGARQEITVFQGEDAPVTAGMVIDNSASMAPKREDVIAAATAFARASNPLDEMFVVHFSDHARMGLPEDTPFTSNVDELKAAISRFELGGTTAFYDALMVAISHFGLGTYNRRIVLAITDGGDNSSGNQPKDVKDAAWKMGAVIFAIGIFDPADKDQNPEALKDLAAATGGQAFFPRSSNEIPKICKQIASDVRHEYTLGFPGAEDGRVHSIRLTARDPRYGQLHVQTRSGYIAVRPS
jgi:VWFA-related protein